MISKIAKLANSTQYVVQLASCLGNTFDLQTLSTVSVMEVEEVEACLANAVSSLKKFQNSLLRGRYLRGLLAHKANKWHFTRSRVISKVY